VAGGGAEAARAGDAGMVPRPRGAAARRRRGRDAGAAQEGERLAGRRRAGAGVGRRRAGEEEDLRVPAGPRRVGGGRIERRHCPWWPEEIILLFQCTMVEPL
jgi:hypothetical protein